MYALASETMKSATRELSVAPDKNPETKTEAKSMNILNPAAQIASLTLLFLTPVISGLA